MPPITTADNNQDQASSTSSILKERRFKLSRACDRCRRRRIKCDEGHPCQACLAANSSCTFEEPGKRTHPHKSKRTATLEDRMLHLESLIQAIPPAVFAAGSAGVASSPAQGGGGVTPTNASIQSEQANLSSPVTPFVYPPQFASGVPPPSLHVFPLMNPSTHFTHEPKPEDRHPGLNVFSGSLLGSSPLGQNPNQSPTMMMMMNAMQPMAATSTPEQLAEETSKMSLSASYLYFDDEGYTRWQGETSGLPVLDLLIERHTPPHLKEDTSTTSSASSRDNNDGPSSTSMHMHVDHDSPGRAPADEAMGTSNSGWFPNRTPRRTDVNPQTLWRLITTSIVPELMDSLVQCYLSTSYYILPFLHVPTFLADYGNPQKWGEPGFAAFIVSICCLASRHMDDPRVRADPADGISAGTQWFDLFGRLRTLPIADRPTLYNIQANLIAAVFAVGLGRLSRAAALLAEAVTMCIDAGLHRTADPYDVFDPIEDEVRKRTFWCVYIWDKQLSAHFGRPAMVRLRDCDVGEPAAVDDEFITKDGVDVPPAGTECRLSAFICTVRIMVVLESVLDVPPVRQPAPPGESSFLARVSGLFLNGSAAARRVREMREEEALLDEIHRGIPSYWAHSAETLGSEDTIRLTQAERLHCAEQFVRLLIYRHRFSGLIAERGSGEDREGGEGLQTEAEKEALIAAHGSALEIIATHLQIAKRGLMTYYGVHVIHQLTQAGRTLVAILLCCKTEALQHLIPSGLEALRSCVGLLRRFSGRYVCGLRSGDLMEEFCRLTQIPLEPTPREEAGSSGVASGSGSRVGGNHNVAPSTSTSSSRSNSFTGNNAGNGSKSRPPWIRPVKKKSPQQQQSPAAPRSTHSGESPASQHSSPEGYSPSEFFVDTATPRKGVTTPTHTTASFGGIRGSFMDTTSPASTSPGGGAAGSMTGLDQEDAQMYMSSTDMLALFNDVEEVDVGHLFSRDYVSQSIHQQPLGHHHSSQQHQRQSSGYHPSASAYLKMNGLVSSP